MRFKLDFSYDDCFLSYAEENQWLNHGKLYESLNFYGILLEFTMYYQSVTVSSIFGVKNFRAPLVSYKRVFFKKTKIRVLSVRRNVNTATSLEISAVSSRKLGHFLFWYCTFHFVTPGRGVLPQNLVRGLAAVQGTFFQDFSPIQGTVFHS